MIYFPPKNLKKNFLLLLYGFLLLFFLLTLSRFGIIKPTVCHFAFFFESVFYTFILTKFVLPTYSYIIEDNRFKIIKTLGDKAVTECDVDIANILEILPYRQYKKQENKKIKCVYNYNANFLSFSCKCLVFQYSGVCETILFEPNKEMINSINRIKDSLSSVWEKINKIIYHFSLAHRKWHIFFKKRIALFHEISA